LIEFQFEKKHFLVNINISQGSVITRLRCGGISIDLVIGTWKFTAECANEIFDEA